MTADTLTDTVASPSHAPTYPAHWLMARLGEIGNIIGGSTPSTKVAEYWNGRIPWLTPNEVTRAADLKIADTERHITEQGLANCSANLLPAGTVMMTSRATIGEVAINTVPMATNQGFINVICDSATIFNEFLAYWLMLHKSALVSRASGSTFLEISKSSFRSIPIMLPPLAEQRAIARILRAAQDTIAARRREVTLERERKAALMQRLFTHGVRGEPTKQTEIGEMPQSWEVVRLGELCEFLQYGTSLRCADEPSGLPVLRIPNVIGGQIDTTDLKYLALPHEEAQSLILERGDLLFVRTNGRKEYTGRCALYDEQPAQAMFASYLIRTRIKRDMALPEFVRIYTETAAGKQQLGGRASNAADGKYNINTQTIRTSLIALPSLDEQQVLAATLAACDSHIAALEREIAVHEELFRALLEELMSGRLSALPLVEGKEVTTDI